MNCPKCNAAMELRRIDEVEIDICSNCSGIFLDDGEFESFTGVDPGTGLIRLSRFVKVLTRLNERAILDELTQVYNRKYFNEFMETVLQNKKREPVSLIAIDIDFFKQVNTQYGHDGGDAVLREVAQRLKRTLRTSRDDYIFRLGGEEFCILLFNLNPDDSFHAADDIRKLVEIHPIALPDGQAIHVTISLGLAFLHPSDTAESLYKRADELLYEAKNSGKNRVVMEKPTAAPAATPAPGPAPGATDGAASAPERQGW